MKKGLLAGLVGALAMLGTAAIATAAVAGSHAHRQGSGWATVNDTCGGASTGSIGFTGGPGTPPAGSGSAKYTVGANGDSYPTLRTGRYNGVKLSALTALDYYTYVGQPGSGSQAVYIDLYVDNDLNGTQDDTLTFEPVYNGTVSTGAWQHWTALTGLWWADSSGGPPPLFTLSSYVSTHPNARIVGGRGFVLAAGCGGAAWTNFVGYADRLTIGVNGQSTTFDFEVPARDRNDNVNHKMKMCHKGHTIKVDRHAVPAHRRHGDTLGPCDREKQKSSHDEQDEDDHHKKDKDKDHDD
jgi:hypothetical protein